MDIKQKAIEKIKATSEFSLASISEGGYPRVCIVSKTGMEGLAKIYASTGLSSTKVRHFKQNPKASICVLAGHDSITLVGDVTVREDQTIKDAMWQDWFINHYTGGKEDPNYCILEFTAREATLWIDNEFVTLHGDALQ